MRTVMNSWISSNTPRRIFWIGCFFLIYVSAFYLGGMQSPSLEIDPSYESVCEYAIQHHFQYGKDLVGPLGPLSFLYCDVSRGQFIGLRVLFAFAWSTLVALSAVGLGKRLPGWSRYAFLAWFVTLSLPSGFDPTAYFVMAYAAILTLIEDPKQRWQVPLFWVALGILPLIKFTFFLAALTTLCLVAACRILQARFREATVLVAVPIAAFISCWIALGQSLTNIPHWIRYSWGISSGYSAALNLIPQYASLILAIDVLVLFLAATMATIRGAPRRLSTWGILITLAQYLFLAWKEGFTRADEGHQTVFLYFLPVVFSLLFLEDLVADSTARARRLREVLFAASMVLCWEAAPLPALQSIAYWPAQVGTNLRIISVIMKGRPADLFAAHRDPECLREPQLPLAKGVIQDSSVDVMNYSQWAALANGMNYHPRMAFQGYLAYTPGLQILNAEHFQGPSRPDFLLFCQQTIDERFPTLDDSSALIYVINNYVPVAEDGDFLVLQQETSAVPALQLVDKVELRFGEKLDLRRWTGEPLFMSVSTTPTLLGRAVTFFWQQRPLYMRLWEGQGEERYRIVPSMAAQPFLLSPLLETNSDLLNLYASSPGKGLHSVIIERPRHVSWDYRDSLGIRLYTIAAFPFAAREMHVSRLPPDALGRIFWPVNHGR